MPLILDGTLGISGVAGSAGTPSYQGTGTTTGVFYPTTTSLGLATDGTERMRIDASGNVGIGTNSANGKAEIVSTSSGTNTNALFLTNASSNASTSTSLVFGVSTAPTIRNATIRGINLGGNAIDLTFLTSNGDAPEERMRISASGNVGIGATSISRKLQISQSNATTYASDFDAAPNQLYIVNTNTTTNAYTGLQMDVGSNSQCAISAVRTGDGQVAMTFSTRVAGVRAERMRISDGGAVLVGTNSPTVYGVDFTQRVVGSGGYVSQIQGAGTGADAVQWVHNTNTSGTRGLIQFVVSGTATVGKISSDGATTTYGTSSDYRLKENIQPMVGALDKIANLKPVTFKWKNTGFDGEGFIAHELSEVCPSAVVGEKDDVDSNGNPVYQGVDTSFLVATLTAAIQELKTRIETLEAK